MKDFLSDNFLLSNNTAQKLFYDFADKMPIIDYHNHLSPELISLNINFENISEAWLKGDHYKWRAMRTFGIDESYITGERSDIEKFYKWSETLPYTLRNPLYHWSQLELKRYFGIDELLSTKSCNEIYENCNSQLLSEENNIHGLLNKMNVEIVCTTDDPFDSLEHHINLKNGNTKFKIFPTFRPDKLINIDNNNYKGYLELLSESTNQLITTYDDLLNSLKNRIDYFARCGCKSSDHGLEYISNTSYSRIEIENIFQNKLSDSYINTNDVEKFKSCLLYDLCLMYNEKGWIQQFHLGAIRNNNSRALDFIGIDSGWDSIGDFSQAKNLSLFLNKLDSTNQLCKTIIYNLNPADNAIFSTMIGNFNDGSIQGKIQHGSAWWFLDQKNGIEQQLNSLSNMSLISQFIGMLTDSRSFLSFPRHEYFRRILCNIFGNEIENGELPNDLDFIGGIIQDICYNNVKKYFNFLIQLNYDKFKQ